MQSLHLVGSSPKRRVFKRIVGSLGWAYPQGFELGANAAVPGCAVGHINPQSCFFFRWPSKGCCKGLLSSLTLCQAPATKNASNVLFTNVHSDGLRMSPEGRLPNVLVPLCYPGGVILGIKDLNCSVKFFILRKANIILEREQRQLWNKKSRQVHLKQRFPAFLMLPKPWIPHVVVILHHWVISLLLPYYSFFIVTSHNVNICCEWYLIYNP